MVEKIGEAGKTVKTDARPGMKKLNVEQLKYTLNKVMQQNSTMYKEYKECARKLEMYQKSEFYSILDWNFKLMECKNPLITDDFKKACASRVMEMMTPKKEEPEENKKEG